MARSEGGGRNEGERRQFSGAALAPTDRRPPAHIQRAPLLRAPRTPQPTNPRARITLPQLSSRRLMTSSGTVVAILPTYTVVALDTETPPGRLTCMGAPMPVGAGCVGGWCVGFRAVVRC